MYRLAFRMMYTEGGDYYHGEIEPEQRTVGRELVALGKAGRYVAGRTLDDYYVADGIKIAEAIEEYGVEIALLEENQREVAFGMDERHQQYLFALSPLGRRAYLSIYSPETHAANDDEMTNVGRFLYDNAFTEHALAVSVAYQEHPAEVGAFAGVARETYQVAYGPVEVACAGTGEACAWPQGKPIEESGNFTWEGVFGWLKEQSQLELSQEEIERYAAVNTGIMAATELLMVDANLPVTNAEFTYLKEGELTGEFKVYLQTHDIKKWGINSGANHLSLLIVPLDHDQFKNDKRFPNSNGRPSLSIGGHWGTKLAADFNRGSDIGDHPLEDQIELEMPAAYSSTAEWSRAIYNATVIFKYKTDQESNLDYDLFPSLDPNNNGYNSNSFTSGLLDVTNTTRPSLDVFRFDIHPGWNIPVPQEYYAND